MKDTFRAFIPAWLNNFTLTQAEFRVYCCLSARADTKTGIAWPSAECIGADCIMAVRTVWKAIKALEEKELIQRLPKPFGKSNRYLILTPSIGAKEHRQSEQNVPLLEDSQSEQNVPLLEDSQSEQNVPRQSEQNVPRQSEQNVPRQSEQNVPREGITKEGITKEGITKEGITKGGNPLPFDSLEFSESWNQWEKHRRELKKKLTPTTKSFQLKQLATMGELRAVKAIAHSITKGWTGIYEPSGQIAQSKSSTPNLGGREGSQDIEDV